MAADIINKQDPTGKAMNPGLVALWEDERLRREAAGVRDSLSPPPSPPRDAVAGERSDSDQFWHRRLCKAVGEQRTGSQPAEHQDPDDPDATINIHKKLRPEVYAVETSERDLESLPDTTGISLSESLLNTSADLTANISHDLYNDQTIVDEEFILSQMEQTKNVNRTDDDLVDLLADLANNAEDESEEEEDGLKTPESMRSKRRSQGSSMKGSKKNHEEDHQEDDDLETLEMSQAVWNCSRDWADQDNTLIENLTKSPQYETQSDGCDMEDLFKQ